MGKEFRLIMTITPLHKSENRYYIKCKNTYLIRNIAFISLSFFLMQTNLIIFIFYYVKYHKDRII